MLKFLADSLIIDILDILIVAFLLYRLLLLVRGTRATQMFVGLGLLAVLSWTAERLGMVVVRQILYSLQTVWVVAFIIIFQPELRTALTYLGRRRGIMFFAAPEEIPAQQEIVHAVERLSRRGLGALIVLEREISLGRWTKTGTLLNADISSELIESIFTVPGPLHDGAVVISQDKIVAASCILPNTERSELGYVLGTRHRAAIGLSEVSDAAVIVVSEETRAISLAHAGEIRRGLSVEELTSELNRIALKGRERVEAAPAPAG
ncbi:MAG: diadenylate cyclase CdaA [Candidatus Latescibacteria bacterium]|nr:diadenylate cyclase CdaA [Candidatus Latescibacterota bacterium]